MFAVLFETRPAAGHHDTYLGLAKSLRPALERVDGFVDNLRWRSLSRPGWLLSLSTWRDEKALVRWRTAPNHHDVQARGRDGVLDDYHLRVGEVVSDTRVPAGQVLREQRLDETQVGAGTAVVLVDGRLPAGDIAAAGAEGVARRLGFRPEADGLVAWDAFEAVLAPGDVIVMATFRDAIAAESFERGARPEDERRLRRVRIVRDYGKHDRREAPQCFPDAGGAPTVRD